VLVSAFPPEQVLVQALKQDLTSAAVQVLEQALALAHLQMLAFQAVLRPFLGEAQPPPLQACPLSRPNSCSSQ
jgi:hypothetical protein